MSIFDALMTINPQATVVPLNRDHARAIGLPLLIHTAQDYKSMMDITLVHWGKPSKQKGHLALSFHILSAVIIPDLAVLWTSCHFQEAIKKSKFVLSQPNLFQTESQGLAFFSGKTPEHTRRKDLSEQFPTYFLVMWAISKRWYYPAHGNGSIINPNVTQKLSLGFSSESWTNTDQGQMSNTQHVRHNIKRSGYSHLVCHRLHDTRWLPTTKTISGTRGMTEPSHGCESVG